VDSLVLVQVRWNERKRCGAEGGRRTMSSPRDGEGRSAERQDQRGKLRERSSAVIFFVPQKNPEPVDIFSFYRAGAANAAEE